MEWKDVKRCGMAGSMNRHHGKYNEKVRIEEKKLYRVSAFMSQHYEKWDQNLFSGNSSLADFE